LSLGSKHSIGGLAGPSVNRQEAPRIPSYRVTGASPMFSSSTYSASGSAVGPYMISLMTIGPTLGAALAAPGVGTLIATKLKLPVLLRCRPRETPPSEASNSSCSL